VDPYRAIGQLAQTPGPTLALLGQRLQPEAGPDLKHVARWLADLDADRFEVREKAAAELEKCGPAVEPALRQALAGQPSPEARRRIEELISKLVGKWEEASLSANELMVLRGVEVLERMATPEARQLLEAWARLPEGHLLAREARAAVQRLKHR
jgi:hypothetical protein